MNGAAMLKRARGHAGLSQEQLATRAKTVRTAVSAYEHGRKAPSLDTLTRLLAGAGFELDAHPRVDFTEVARARGRSVWVPTSLPRLAPEKAFAAVQLPVTLNWSDPDRVHRLARRSDRARVYEIVLREGQSHDILDYIDGALLVDLWPDLVLPRDVRRAWQPLIDSVLGASEAP